MLTEFDGLHFSKIESYYNKQKRLSHFFIASQKTGGCQSADSEPIPYVNVTLFHNVYPPR